jgi:hypothetical protein
MSPQNSQTHQGGDEKKEAEHKDLCGHHKPNLVKGIPLAK